VGLNVEKPPLDDLRVRQAIRKAIDVDQVILAGYNGTVERANALMAPGLLGHWADAPVYQRDLEGAKKLLAEAGHAGGLDLRLTLLNQSQYVTAAQVIQANLAEAGINLELEVLDGGSYWSMGEGEAGENLELSLQQFGGKADPSFQSQWFVSEQTGEWNWQRWQNSEYDKLNAEAEATVDEEARAAAYIKMQQLMDESAAFIWLTHEVNMFASKKWLNPAILPNGDDWQYRHFEEKA
jgi:peptide/nickel transport system substrate-binding protein